MIRSDNIFVQCDSFCNDLTLVEWVAFGYMKPSKAELIRKELQRHKCPISIEMAKGKTIKIYIQWHN